jgi:pyridoxamine 5'-phosphate oxidase
MAIMSKNEILEALNANPVCAFATAEGKKPHVRYFAMVKAEESGLIFQAWTLKDVHQQLVKNPEVELCFNTKDGKQIRIAGRVEIVNDISLKQEVVAKRPFMKPIIDEKGWDVATIYRVKGQASVWGGPKENFTPKTWVDL